MKSICAECGDTKILNNSGVCKNRHGCQHRQYQHRVRMERLLVEMEQQEWHAQARERQSQWQAYMRHPSNQGDDSNGYSPASSLLDFWKHGHPSQTNLWVDKWLHGDDEDDE